MAEINIANSSVNSLDGVLHSRWDEIEKDLQALCDQVNQNEKDAKHIIEDVEKFACTTADVLQYLSQRIDKLSKVCIVLTSLLCVIIAWIVIGIILGG